MTVLFGGTSVGKTALLREVLADPEAGGKGRGRYWVVKFDLRISGFADLRTLYRALCEQFQTFFEEVSWRIISHPSFRATLGVLINQFG